MPRKPAILQGGSSSPAGDKGLAVRDGLREVRFNMKHGARKLVQAVEAAAHRRDDASQGPLALLGEPLHRAVRTAAALLSHVDDAAVDLLAPDAAYRSMSVKLCSSAAYFAGPGLADRLRVFATDHHWRYRHWLAMKQCSDVFVHEQAIAIAGAQVAGAKVAAADAATQDVTPTDAEWHERTTVPIVRALQREAILGKPALAADEDPDGLLALGALGAVVTVLAGEITGRLHALGGREQYVGALRLADEIAVADRAGWETALRGPAPAQAMGRWLAFVLRHA